MSDTQEQTFAGRYRAWRRKTVYHLGEKTTRVVSGFFSRQGLVEDRPFMRNEDFPFLKMFSGVVSRDDVDRQRTGEEAVV